MNIAPSRKYFTNWLYPGIERLTRRKDRIRFMELADRQFKKFQKNHTMKHRILPHQPGDRWQRIEVFFDKAS